MSSTLRRSRGRTWLRAATTVRMLLLLALVVLLVVVFLRLGGWQYERSGVRGAEAAQVEREHLLAAPAVPIDEVVAPQAAFGAEQFGRRVSLHGVFEAAQQLLVPDREVDGQGALLVVTAFHVIGGPHDGAIMPVLRGWLPEDEALADRLEAGREPAMDVTAPPPNEGEVTIVGMLSNSEASDPRDLPPGFVGAISAGELINTWGAPMYNAYLVVETPSQSGGISPAPSPVSQIDADPNLQSLAYAFEWWAFAAFAVVFWVKVLLDNVRAQQRAGEPAH